MEYEGAPGFGVNEATGEIFYHGMNEATGEVAAPPPPPHVSVSPASTVPGWSQGDPAPLAAFLAWQGPREVLADGTIQGTTGRLDPATGLVHYKLQNDTLFGGLVDIAKVLGVFVAAAFGANAITGWIGPAGAGGASVTAVPTAESIAAGITGGENAIGAMYLQAPAAASLPTADSILAGIEGGENAAGAMYLTETPPLSLLRQAASVLQGSQVAGQGAGGAYSALAGQAGRSLAGLAAAGLSSILGGGAAEVPQYDPNAVQAGGSAGLVLLIGAAAVAVYILKVKK